VITTHIPPSICTNVHAWLIQKLIPIYILHVEIKPINSTQSVYGIDLLLLITPITWYIKTNITNKKHHIKNHINQFDYEYCQYLIETS